LAWIFGKMGHNFGLDFWQKNKNYTSISAAGAGAGEHCVRFGMQFLIL
jgi:hypothetical protein